MVFGFAFTPNRFGHQIDDAHVDFVTESGIRVSGPAAAPHVVLPAGVELGAIADAIVVAADDAEQSSFDASSGGEPFSLSIVTVPPAAAPDSVDDLDLWSSIALRFATDYYDMAGTCGAGVPEFIDKVRLREELAAAQPSPAAEVHVPGYITRVIDGTRTDVDVLRSARAWGLHVLQEGRPGTGKTTAVRAAFGDELVVRECVDGMLAQDLVGAHLPVPGQAGVFEWRDGPLLQAMLEGRPLLLDDVGWMPPGVQALLLPVLDDRRSIQVTDRPGEQVVTAAAGFCVVLNANPGIGYGLIDPLADRVAFRLQVPLDMRAAAQLGVPDGFLRVAATMVAVAEAEASKGVFRWVPPMRLLLRARELTAAFDEHFAASAWLSACPDGVERQKLRELLVAELGLARDEPQVLAARAV